MKKFNKRCVANLHTFFSHKELKSDILNFKNLAALVLTNNIFKDETIHFVDINSMMLDKYNDSFQQYFFMPENLVEFVKSGQICETALIQENSIVDLVHIPDFNLHELHFLYSF